MKLKVLQLIRYKNYIKNLLIFLPLFLNNTSWVSAEFNNLVFAFIFFSILASSIYIINDFFDLKIDKKHSIKKFRPLASGKISKKFALIISIIFLFLSFLYFFFQTKSEVFLLIVFYFIVNFLYSSYLKNLKYIDLILVALGFLVRIYIGALISNIENSNYLIFQVLLFSIFILICKRRENFFKYEYKIKSKYKLKELNILSKLFLILNIVNYLSYIFNVNRFPDSLSLEISFLIYTFLVLRYYFINNFNKMFDPISILLNDKYLKIFSLLYFINF